MGKKCLYYVVIAFFCVILFASCSLKSNEGLPDKNINNNVYLGEENVGGLKRSEALKKIENYASQIDIEAREAKLNNERWEIEEKEKAGRKVNVEKTLDMLLKSNEGDKVNIVVEEVVPSNYVDKLKSNIVEIASYSTKLLDKQENRVNNIEIASESLNYIKVAPGEEFSFNKTLGRRTQSKGYEKAPVIVKTEDGYDVGSGVGGGICQLSTTLFNAAEKCGLEVTERYIHSKDIEYVPSGRDATVSYGSTDFKFKNNRNYPVMIRTYLSKNYLTVKIFENRN